MHEQTFYLASHGETLHWSKMKSNKECMSPKRSEGTSSPDAEDRWFKSDPVQATEKRNGHLHLVYASLLCLFNRSFSLFEM